MQLNKLNIIDLPARSSLSSLCIESMIFSYCSMKISVNRFPSISWICSLSLSVALSMAFLLKEEREIKQPWKSFFSAPLKYRISFSPITPLSYRFTWTWRLIEATPDTSRIPSKSIPPSPTFPISCVGSNPRVLRGYLSSLTMLLLKFDYFVFVNLLIFDIKFQVFLWIIQELVREITKVEPSGSTFYKNIGVRSSPINGIPKGNLKKHFKIKGTLAL